MPHVFCLCFFLGGGYRRLSSDVYGLPLNFRTIQSPALKLVEHHVSFVAQFVLSQRRLT